MNRYGGTHLSKDFTKIPLAFHVFLFTFFTYLHMHIHACVSFIRLCCRYFPEKTWKDTESRLVG